MKLFYKDFVNIFLKYSQSIKKGKKHKLVFKITLLSLKKCFSLITFTDLDSIIGIGKI